MAKKANEKICKKTCSVEGVDFAFSNGHSHFVKPTDFPQNIQDYLPSFGVNHKLGDSWSTNAGVNDAEQTFLAVMANMKAGNWNMKGEGSGGAVCEAVAFIKKLDIADVRKAWAKKTDEEKKAIENDPRVKSRIADMLAEKRKAAVTDDTPELDWEFEDGSNMK